MNCVYFFLVRFIGRVYVFCMKGKSWSIYTYRFSVVCFVRCTLLLMVLDLILRDVMNGTEQS
jgi:cbb3-type cytochrome oxidase subunit 1